MTAVVADARYGNVPEISIGKSVCRVRYLPVIDRNRSRIGHAGRRLSQRKVWCGAGILCWANIRKRP